MAGRPGYSLSSTQQILAKKGSKHRTCLSEVRAPQQRPSSRASAVVRPMPIFTITAFKSINSSIYQWYINISPCNHLEMNLHVPAFHTYPQEMIFSIIFQNCLSKPVVMDHEMSLRSNRPVALTSWPGPAASRRGRLKKIKLIRMFSWNGMYAMS